jgi:3-oxoadipate enol-lactonase
VKLAYTDRGNGLPVVWLHGFPHNRSLWDSQIDAMGSEIRSIAPDLRGLGASPAQPPYSMDSYADDVVELLDGLGITVAVIAGLSMGGYIAFALWRRHHDRIRALILADTKAHADTEDGKAKRRSLISLAKERGAGAIADAQITGMIGSTTTKTRPDLVARMHAMLSAAPVDGIVGALEAMMQRPDSTGTLGTIDVPTLVIAGEEDALTPVKESRSLRAAIRNSELAIIPAAGHVSNFEKPEEFNSAVRPFLDRIRGGS